MSIFTSKFFWKCLIKNQQLTNSDPKRKGVGKCPPSCQLEQKQLLPLFSECNPSACTGTDRECDSSLCKCKSGFVEDPTITSPGPTDACVAGRKTLTTETFPNLSTPVGWPCQCLKFSYLSCNRHPRIQDRRCTF